MCQLPVKLYLSSYRVGEHRQALRELVGAGHRAAVVANAHDAFVQPRSILGREVEDLAAIGFKADELDLRQFFGAPERLRKRLVDLDLLWITGGNSFVLTRAMNACGFSSAAETLVREDRLVYGGYSAGVCAIGPTLDGIHLMDEPEALPQDYPSRASAVPLGWVPWTVVPHWRSDHPESATADLAVDYLLHAGLPFRTLRDGSAIVIDGDSEVII